MASPWNKSACNVYILETDCSSASTILLLGGGTRSLLDSLGRFRDHRLFDGHLGRAAAARVDTQPSLMGWDLGRGALRRSLLLVGGLGLLLLLRRFLGLLLVHRDNHPGPILPVTGELLELQLEVQISLFLFQ